LRIGLLIGMVVRLLLVAFISVKFDDE